MSPRRLPGPGRPPQRMCHEAELLLGARNLQRIRGYIDSA